VSINCNWCEHNSIHHCIKYKLCGKGFSRKTIENSPNILLQTNYWVDQFSGSLFYLFEIIYRVYSNERLIKHLTLLKFALEKIKNFFQFISFSFFRWKIFLLYFLWIWFRVYNIFFPKSILYKWVSNNKKGFDKFMSCINHVYIEFYDDGILCLILWAFYDFECRWKFNSDFCVGILGSF
jgi:hypothetical protein